MTKRRRPRRKSTFVKRKKRGGVKVLLLSILVVVTFFTTVFIFFRINSASVSGNSRYTADEILEALEFKKGENIFLFDKNAAAERIENALPYIKDAEVSRSFPNKIKVEVIETKAYVYTQIDHRFYLLDESGKVLEETAARPELPELKGSGITEPVIGEVPEYRDEVSLRAYRVILKNLINYDFYDSVTELNISKRHSITFDIDARICVNIGNSENLDIKLGAITQCLAEQEIVEKALVKLQDNTASKIIIRELSDSEWLDLKLEDNAS